MSGVAAQALESLGFREFKRVFNGATFFRRRGGALSHGEAKHGREDATVNADGPAGERYALGIFSIEHALEIVDVEVQEPRESKIEQLRLAVEQDAQEEACSQLARNRQLLDEFARIADGAKRALGYRHTGLQIAPADYIPDLSRR
jgi:hypothetical protein